MTDVGFVKMLIQKYGSTPSPADIEEAVNTYLEDHPEAVAPIDDAAGEGDTGKLWSADKVATETESLKEAIENVEDDLESLLVQDVTQTVTLTNGENASQYYNSVSGDGLGRDSLSAGVAKFVSTSGQTTSPSAIHTINQGTKKWLVGMKIRYTKLDENLGNPNGFFVRLGRSGSYRKTELPLTWGEWLQFEDCAEFELYRIYISADGFATSPGANKWTLEVKDMYVYDVTGVDSGMVDYIKQQQRTNYADGAVTYTMGTGDYAPDTTLTEEGKVPDSKAVGDAITNAVKAPLNNSLNGVAFGTSLTSRPKNGNPGYLTYLPDMIGITFDNQGEGSAKIKSDILTAIKGYTGYANKNVCIIEGFVNDWKYDIALGTWKDTGETTACGCLRSAINYVLSQNANITMFIVFDHYGRNNQSDDRSSTAQNTANLTQYEYYEELAKVAESLGIPVIKQYAGSQISENTPQFMADYIHLNEVGAKQSANFIYSKMKQYFQNEQPSA